MEKEIQVRLDKYLWCIRIFKTRALAKTAIEKGKVRCNDTPCKPSKIVNLGEVYEIRATNRITIKVKRLLNQRKKHSEAIECYEDITPEADRELNQAKYQSSFHTGKRLSKTGKPNKKDRREMNDFLDEI